MVTKEYNIYTNWCVCVLQVRLLEPIRPSELSPGPATRDAMAALLRRRLLEASVCPHISAGRLPPPDALPRTTLSTAERLSGLVTLAVTILVSGLLFRKISGLLTDDAPSGLALSSWHAAGWATLFSLGVTAAIFVYYSLKLRRGASKQKKA
jgi:hypothetical protein